MAYTCKYTHSSLAELEYECENIPDLVEEILFAAGLRTKEEYLLHHPVEVSTVILNECVEIALFLLDEMHEVLPRTFNHLQMAVSF